MAYLKIRHREKMGYTEGKYHDDNAIRDVITYITAPSKTPSGYIGGIAINPSNAIFEMESLSAYYGQNKGVRLRHIILGFEKGELCALQKTAAKLAYNLSYPIAQYYGTHHQIVYAVHEDTDMLHVHFVMNTTNYITGMKYDGSRRDLYRFIDHIENVLEPFGTKVKYVTDTTGIDPNFFSP